MYYSLTFQPDALKKYKISKLQTASKTYILNKPKPSMLCAVASTIGSIIVDGRMYPPTNNSSAASSAAGASAAMTAGAQAAGGPQRLYSSPPQQHAAAANYHNRVSPLQGLALMPNQLGTRNPHQRGPAHHQQGTQKRIMFKCQHLLKI